MVKLFENKHTFHHPWSNVTSAFWRKYPNDLSPHVKEVDTFCRRVTPSGRLVVHRLIRVESALPSFLSVLNIPTSCYAIETTTVAVASKHKNASNSISVSVNSNNNSNSKSDDDEVSENVMVVSSRNLTGSQFMVVEEECTYRPDSANPEHTQYTQTAKLRANLPLFSSKFEDYSLASFVEKSKKGLAVMESLCQHISIHGLMSLTKIDQLQFSVLSPTTRKNTSNTSSSSTTSTETR